MAAHRHRHRPREIGPRDEDFRAYAERGDVEALARYFDAAAPRLMLVAAHVAPVGVEAEDLVQQTFLEALRGRYEPRDDASALTWLASILRRRAIDEHRRAHRIREETLDEEHDPASAARGPDERLMDDETFALVVAAIDALEPPRREVVNLRLVLGHDLATIAHTLGRKPSTVRMQLKRGLERLREALPTGIATALVAALVTDRGLAQVRDAVLLEARRLAPAPSPDPSVTGSSSFLALPSTSVLTLAMLALATIALVVLATDPFGSEPTPSSTTTTLATSSNAGSAAVGIEPATPALAESGASVSATRRPIASVDRPIGANEEAARIFGSIQRPDGSPLTEGALELYGWRNVAGESLQSHDESAPLGEDGAFAIEFEPRDGFQYTLKLDAPDQVRAAWRWPSIAPGAGVDLGATTLPEHAAIRIGVVDAQGVGVVARWEIQVDSQWRPSGPGASAWWGRERLAEASDAIAIERVPLGACTIGVSTRATADSTIRRALVLDGDTTIQLTHAGPAPTRTICADLTCRSLLQVGVDPAFVHLETASGERIGVTRTGSVGHRHYFEELAPGTYTLVCEDPRFEALEVPDVELGAIVHRELVGSSRVRLAIATGDGSPPPDRISIVAMRPFVGNWGDEWTYGELRPVEPVPSQGADALSDTSASAVEYATLPGRQRWRLVADGWAPVSLAFAPELAAGTTRSVSVVLHRPVSVVGRVVDTNGRPVAGAEVLVRRSLPLPDESGPWPPVSSFLQQIQLETTHTTTTDDDGSFQVDGLADEPHDLLAVAGRGVWAAIRAQAPTGEPATLTVPATCRVEGRLVTDEGVDPRDFEVLLDRTYDQGPIFWRHPLDRYRGEWMRSGVDLRPDGRFAVSDLAPGDARIELRLPNALLPSGLGGTQTVRGACVQREVLELSASQPREVVLDATGLRVRTAAVAVSVDGPALPGIAVRAIGRLDPSIALAEGEDAEQRTIAAAGVVGADGVARVGPLHPGTWDFAITGGNGAWQTIVARDVVVPVHGDEPLEFVYGAEVHRGVLELVDASGAPHARAMVGMPRWSGFSRDLETPRSFASARNDANGRLELTLPAGRHTFVLEDPSNEPHERGGTDFTFEWPPQNEEPLRVVVRSDEE